MMRRFDGLILKRKESTGIHPESILHFSEHNVLVICDQNVDFNAIDVDTGEILKEFKVYDQGGKVQRRRFAWVNHIIKWDDDTFLASLSDGNIYQFDVSNLSDIDTYEEVYYKEYENIKKLLKISHDLCVACVYSMYEEKPLHVISVSQKRLAYDLVPSCIYTNTRIILSKIHPNTFYVNCCLENERTGRAQTVSGSEQHGYLMKQIDFREKKCVRTYPILPNDTGVLEVFTDQRYGELILAGGMNNVFSLFSSTSEIPLLDRIELFEKPENFSGYVHCSYFCSNKREHFLFLGFTKIPKVKIIEVYFSSEKEQFDTREVYDTEDLERNVDVEKEDDTQFTDLKRRKKGVYKLVGCVVEDNTQQNKKYENNNLGQNDNVIIGYGYEIFYFSCRGLFGWGSGEQDLNERVEYLSVRVDDDVIENEKGGKNDDYGVSFFEIKILSSSFSFKMYKSFFLL